MLEYWKMLDARRAAVARLRQHKVNLARDRAVLELITESQRRAHAQLFTPAPAAAEPPFGLCVAGRASW